MDATTTELLPEEDTDATVAEILVVAIAVAVDDRADVREVALSMIEDNAAEADLLVADRVADEVLLVLEEAVPPPGAAV